jgi:hypothetical protein
MNSLTYGKYYDRKKIIMEILPESELKRRLFDVKSSLVSQKLDYNEFENLQRSEFKEFFELKGGLYVQEIISSLRNALPPQILNKTINQFQDINISTSHGKSSEVLQKMEDNPDIIYNILFIQKYIFSSIIQKVMDKYVIVKKDKNTNLLVFLDTMYSKQPHKEFKTLNSILRYGLKPIQAEKGYNPESEEKTLSGENAVKFIDKCQILNIKLWEVEIIKDIMDNDGYKRPINITDIEKIGKAFGNMIYGQGIANLLFSMHELQLSIKHLHGSEFMLVAD